MKYYTVCVFGTDTELKTRVAGCHIIRATSKEDALRIREKHGISNPRFAKGELRITCTKSKLYGKWEQINLALLERRRKGIGGSIWYEDENGNLQTETKMMKR